jgi:hypothetical protein
VRSLREHTPYRFANGLLSVGDDAANRHRQCVLDLLRQHGQVVGRPTEEEATRQEHFTGEAVAEHLEDVVTSVRLQTIAGQDDSSLLRQLFAHARLIGGPQGNHLFRALEQGGDAPFGDRHSPGSQHRVNLRHASLLGNA